MEELFNRIISNVHLINNKIVPIFEKRCLSFLEINKSFTCRTQIYVQSIMNRNVDLLKSISICAENHLALPIILSARALLENTAAFLAFYNELNEEGQKNNFINFDQIIDQHARKTYRDEYLKEFTKQEQKKYRSDLKSNRCMIAEFYPEVIDHYSQLSERCHPNYDGTIGLYCTIESNRTVSFERGEKYFNELLNAMTEIQRSGKIFCDIFNKILNLTEKADLHLGILNNSFKVTKEE